MRSGGIGFGAVKALIRVPIVLAVGPRKHRGEGHEHEVETPSQDDDVVDVHEKRDHRRRVPDAAHDRADFPSADRTSLFERGDECR